MRFVRIPQPHLLDRVVQQLPVLFHAVTCSISTGNRSNGPRRIKRLKGAQFLHRLVLSGTFMMGDLKRWDACDLSILHFPYSRGGALCSWTELDSAGPHNALASSKYDQTQEQAAE